MSITHSESGQPNFVHSSGGAKELTGRSRGDYPVDGDGDGAVDALRQVSAPMTIASKNWGIAEEATHEIIQKVRPTSESEERRREVIGYIQRLIRKYLGVEVLPYGSVPLKTYLPDGDIDLTAFGGANVEDLLVDDMKFLLEREEKNSIAEFDVKDVQLIRAEVKLVKCIVQDIVVDVSFNQIGGLCTLCFLEQIDRLIGKDHLFKRSIILIKAWCYYESRILGAHHGLISTYALETLVLYIFHLYHSTLDGPLAVLYKFLDYFSKFDWETYCVTLNGPMCLSSLPAVIVEMPEDSDGNLLLTSDFLSSCIDMFSVPSRGGDQSSRGFQQKHLNIVDPLKETNNLGRSVSQGNFYRVRSAFTYGAKKLARILSEPENAIAHELHKFFANTMARNGSKQRPNIQNFDLSLTCNGSISMPPVSEICKSDNSTYGHRGEHTITSRDVLSHRISGDANEHATCGLGGLKISVDSSESETPKLCYAPHLFFAKSKFHNSSMKDGNQDSDKLEVMCESLDKNMSVQKDEVVPLPSIQRDFHATHERVPLTNSEMPESLNLLTDLTGDYDSYFQYLQYGRWCYEHSSGLHIPPPSSPNTVHQHNPFANRNDFSNQHRNGFHQSPAVYPMQHVLIPGVPFGWEEMPKPRGTGTYFPNMNQPPHGYRPSTITGMNTALPRPPFNNVRNMIFPQSSNIKKSTHEPSQSQVSGEKVVTVGSFNSYQSFSPRGSEYPNCNGFNVKLEGIPDFESAGNASISETSKQLKPAFNGDQDRNSLRNSYLLKDEDDFPPL